MTTADKAHPIQNMGLIDRLVRCAVGAWLLGMMVFYYEMYSTRLSQAAMFYAIATGAYFVGSSGFRVGRGDLA